MQRSTPEVVLQALESIHREKYGGGGTATQFEDEVVPPLMRRSIAVYEAARCLIGYITPHYDEISKVQLLRVNGCGEVSQHCSSACMLCSDHCDKVTQHLQS